MEWRGAMAGDGAIDDKVGHFRVQRVLVDPAKPPKAAHAFIWARSGTEFVLEVGFFDFLQMHEAINSVDNGASEVGDLPKIPLFITDRYALSQEALLRLANAVSSMTAELPKEPTDAT